MNKQVTGRFRGKSTDMFARRVVITIPPSGVLVVAAAAGIALLRFPYYLLSTVALISVIIAAVTIVEARHQLRTFRYEMREKITAALEDWAVPDDLPDLRETEFGVIEDDAPIRRVRIPRKSA